MSTVPFLKVPIGLPCPGTNDLLYSILQSQGGGGGSGGLVQIDQTTPGTTNAVQLVGIVRNSAIAVETDSSNSPVPSDAKYVGFIFSPDFTGTVLGAAYAGPVDSSQDFTAPAGDVLGDIDYTVTAGNMRIVTIR